MVSSLWLFSFSLADVSGFRNLSFYIISKHYLHTEPASQFYRFNQLNYTIFYIGKHSSDFEVYELLCGWLWSINYSMYIIKSIIGQIND